MAETGALWELIERWAQAQPYRVSQRQLAKRIGVSSGLIGQWKHRSGWPEPANLRRLAQELELPYETVLNAVLIDRGYRQPRPNDPSPRRRSVG